MDDNVLIYFHAGKTARSQVCASGVMKRCDAEAARAKTAAKGYFAEIVELEDVRASTSTASTTTTTSSRVNGRSATTTRPTSRTPTKRSTARCTGAEG